MDALPTAEPSLPQEVPSRAGGAAGRVLCDAHALGTRFDEVFVVGRFCDRFGESALWFLLEDF